VRLFRRVARLKPQDLETLINLQQTLDRVGEKEEAAAVGEAIKEIRFDPDGRLTFTWLKGPGRERVTERVSVPSLVR